MIKRFGALALAALALTACTTGGDDKGPLPSPAPSSAATTSPPAAAPTAATPTPAATTAPPAAAPAPGETGAGDWKSALAAVLACPDGAGPVEQGPLVNRDLTGDGVPDVLVAGACTGSTSSWPSVVHVYDGAPPAGQWRRLGVLLTQEDGEDERGLRVKKILIEDGTIVVTSRAYRKTDNNADGGSLTVTDRFTWTGTGFRRGDRTIA
ncbi:hypothetical protein [Catenuloplanes japonicus]|uniref:hypothetical protein n=1 Tax=Catenuloplanes japonicus TaxID=33876 RepID=UPI00068EE7A9|nr:hypothetical protein [Catenuloplanes japonicus]